MSAQVQHNFFALEKSSIWTYAEGGNIAPNPPDAKKIVFESDGIRLYTISSLPYAGWMAKAALLLPPLPPQFTVSLSLDVECDEGVSASMQALEMDTMVAMADGRVGNTSFEYNLKEGGHCQIVDKNYKWTDIGFNPPLDSVTKFQFNNAYDQAAGLSSVQRISVDGTPFNVPITMQGIPFQDLKWDKNRLIIQLQSNMIQAGGACSVKFSNIDATVLYNL